MKIEAHQAEAHAAKHSEFKTATVVLVDEHGNVRFDPTDEAREEFESENKVYIVKDGLTDSKHNSGEGE